MMEMQSVELKGVIKCPVCGRNPIYVYPDTKGHVSQQCKVCEKFILIDYDKMTAITISATSQNSIRICKQETEH